MIAFAQRNPKVFFRDRASVFFSLLAVFIVLGLYAAFLRSTLTRGLEHIPGAEFLMDSWTMAGLLAVTSLTTTLGAAGVLVDDKVKGIAKDFRCAPLKRSTIVGGYLLASVAVGIVLTTLAFVLSQVFIWANGGKLLTLAAVLKTLGLIVLSSVTSGAFISFLVSFIKTPNAFAVASTVIGTLSGFLTGIYVPISMLPSGIQTAVKLFPISHAAVLFRQVMMEVPLAEAFAGAPEAVLTSFQEDFGIMFRFGDAIFSAAGSVAVLVGTTFVFFLLAVWRMLKEGK